ncbi:MAG: type II toxin-antitoxin system VapC family toxin [Gemmataceae bacterium]
MRYLLDANAWIAHFRKSSPEVTRRLSQHVVQEIVLCSVVLGELQYGVERCPPAQRAVNQRTVDEVHEHHESFSFDDAAAKEYARIRADLALRGLMIGSNDLQIAAIARVNGFTLVTHNVAEFSRVPGLVIEDWQAPEV